MQILCIKINLSFEFLLSTDLDIIIVYYKHWDLFIFKTLGNVRHLCAPGTSWGSDNGRSFLVACTDCRRLKRTGWPLEDSMPQSRNLFLELSFPPEEKWDDNLCPFLPKKTLEMSQGDETQRSADRTFHSPYPSAETFHLKYLLFGCLQGERFFLLANWSGFPKKTGGCKQPSWAGILGRQLSCPLERQKEVL